MAKTPTKGKTEMRHYVLDLKVPLLDIEDGSFDLSEVISQLREMGIVVIQTRETNGYITDDEQRSRLERIPGSRSGPIRDAIIAAGERIIA